MFVGLEVSNSSFSRFHIRDTIHTGLTACVATWQGAVDLVGHRAVDLVGHRAVAFGSSFWTPTSHSERLNRQRCG